MLKAILFSTILFLFHSGVTAELYDPNASKKYSVLTLSAAIVDHLFLISDSDLKSIANEKESWAPIDYPALCSILDRNRGISKMVSGGSGANIMKGLAQLGEQCAIIGKVGADDKGDYYVKSMKELGVGTFLERGTLPTGQAICLVTPDGKRTFRSYLGASHSLTDLTLDPKFLSKLNSFILKDTNW